MNDKPKKKITALDIKYTLMYYFRFKRQCICATECLNNDVMVITDKDVIDVEIKINKYDLWKGEERKFKHKQYKNMSSKTYKNFMGNRFYICIPKYLEDEALKWVKATNDKYGIITYYGKHQTYITKRAKSLIKGVSKQLEKSIMMRVCSENITFMGKKLDRIK